MILRRNIDRHQVACSSNCPPERTPGAGSWKNRLGYTLRKIRDEKYLWTTKAIYECQLSDFAPLTYVDETGIHWRPRPRFETDMGSIPILAQILIPRDRGLLSYLLHDDACSQRRLMMWEPGMPQWRQVSVSRRRRDGMLYDCLIAEGVGKAQAFAVWCAVRAYAVGSGQAR